VYEVGDEVGLEKVVAALLPARELDADMTCTKGLTEGGKDGLQCLAVQVVAEVDS